MTPTPYDPSDFVVERRIADIEDMRRRIGRSMLPSYVLLAVILLIALITIGRP